MEQRGEEVSGLEVGEAGGEGWLFWCGGVAVAGYIVCVGERKGARF